MTFANAAVSELPGEEQLSPANSAPWLRAARHSLQPEQSRPLLPRAHSKAPEQIWALPLPHALDPGLKAFSAGGEQVPRSLVLLLLTSAGKTEGTGLSGPDSAH